jgi:hypothetical protein
MAVDVLLATNRFADDPKLLAVEWEDGATPSQFVTPARDAVLAAVLSAAQAASGRPIAVMPGVNPLASVAALCCGIPSLPACRLGQLPAVCID